MTQSKPGAIGKNETKRGALRTFRHMHAATEPGNLDCEDKSDPDERHRSQQDGHEPMK